MVTIKRKGYIPEKLWTRNGQDLTTYLNISSGKVKGHSGHSGEAGFYPNENIQQTLWWKC